MIKAMDDDDYVKLLDRAFTFQLALVSNGNLGSDNFTKVQKEAKEIFQDIEGEMKPWLGKRSREDRAKAERDNFAELWEEFAGFALDDQEALAEWESQLSKHTSGSVADLQERESAEAAQSENFKKRVEEIRQKRARQQGR